MCVRLVGMEVLVLTYLRHTHTSRWLFRTYNNGSDKEYLCRLATVRHFYVLKLSRALADWSMGCRTLFPRRWRLLRYFGSGSRWDSKSKGQKADGETRRSSRKNTRKWYWARYPRLAKIWTKLHPWIWMPNCKKLKHPFHSFPQWALRRDGYLLVSWSRCYLHAVYKQYSVCTIIA